MKRGVFIGAIVALARVVYAGGLEFPDNGTVALGRGGAFTAKADDGTALEYNVAGLARQRGTRLLFDGNLVLSSMEFQRDGVYPDANTPATPWGGQPFPLVRNTGGPFFAPFIALSTDFGLDRWTFAIGLFGPSSVGNRTYPLSVGGLPSPARYDLVQALPLVVLPTAAVAVRATRWLDIGLALHVAVGKLDLTSVSFTDISKGVCPNPEYQPCDSTNKLSTTGATATAALGLLLRPVRWWALGVNVRGPVYLNTSGTVTATAPAALPMKIDPAPATFSTNLPWVVRAGTRFIKARDDGFEVADFEIDGTYENWAAAQGDGPKVNIPALSLFQDIHPTIVHHYHDTFSVRAGAAYHVPLRRGEVSFRVGGYYDSSATDPKDTRLDFDTLAKAAATVGLGVRWHGFSFDVAYAYVHSFDRVVTDGDIRPVNGAQHGDTVDDMGNPLPPVNNGSYHAETHIISFGLGFRFDELVGRTHHPAWPESEARVVMPPRAPSAVRPPPSAPEEASADAAPSDPSASPAPSDDDERMADGGRRKADLDFAPEPIRHARRHPTRHHRQGRRAR